MKRKLTMRDIQSAAIDVIIDPKRTLQERVQFILTGLTLIGSATIVIGILIDTSIPGVGWIVGAIGAAMNGTFIFWVILIGLLRSGEHGHTSDPAGAP